MCIRDSSRRSASPSSRAFRSRAISSSVSGAPASAAPGPALSTGGGVGAVGTFSSLVRRSATRSTKTSAALTGFVLCEGGRRVSGPDGGASAGGEGRGDDGGFGGGSSVAARPGSRRASHEPTALSASCLSSVNSSCRSVVSRSIESSAMDLETTLRHELLTLLRQDAESAVGSWLARRLPGLAAKEEPPPKPPSSPRPSPPADAPPSGPETRRPPSQRTKPVRAAEVFVDRVADLLTKDEKVPTAPTPPPVERAGPGAALAGAPLTEEEIALDRKARELGDALLRESAAYRFSTPADRREALRSLVVKELHALQPAGRPRVLEQLRLQFPVVAPGDVPNLEELRLRRRVAELERRLAEAASRPAAAASKSTVAASLPWRTLLTPEDGKASTLEPRLAVLRDVLRFAQDVETFTLGLVEAMTMPGAETANFRLPNFRDRLSVFFAAAAEGKDVNPDDVRDYLAELRRWQIAISAGHHEAPKLWFTKLWKRISPAVIEAGKPEAGWKLRGETAEWWNQYRDLVKDLNPDLVQDQVLQAAAHFSQAEFQKLNKRK